MPSLSGVGDRFYTTYKTTDGREFRAHLESIQRDFQNRTDFLSPRRRIRVPVNAVVTSGDVMVAKSGEKFLIVDPQSGEMGDTQLYRLHRVLEITGLYVWERPSSGTDTLTNLPKAGSLTPMGMIYCVIEPFDREDMDSVIQVRQERYRCITGADIHDGDVIDGKKVKRVQNLMGVKVAEIQA